jgi:hypothetical protein
VNRGGSFNNAASNARSANRNNNTPENRDNNLGLRPSKATHRPIAPALPPRCTSCCPVLRPVPSALWRLRPNPRRGVCPTNVKEHGAIPSRPVAWMRETLAQIAGWRLRKHRYGFPLEQKLFDLYVRATGQLDPGAKDYVPAVDA